MVFFIADSEQGSGRPKAAASSGGNVTTCKIYILITRLPKTNRDLLKGKGNVDSVKFIIPTFGTNNLAIEI